jgi:flagellar hook-length control protein FliK
LIKGPDPSAAQRTSIGSEPAAHGTGGRSGDFSALMGDMDDKRRRPEAEDPRGAAALLVAPGPAPAGAPPCDPAPPRRCSQPIPEPGADPDAGRRAHTSAPVRDVVPDPGVPAESPRGDDDSSARQRPRRSEPTPVEPGPTGEPADLAVERAASGAQTRPEQRSAPPSIDAPHEAPHDPPPTPSGDAAAPAIVVDAPRGAGPAPAASATTPDIAPAIPAVPTMEAIERVGAALLRAARAGEQTRVEVELDPPELGRVYLDIRLDAGRLHVQGWTAEAGAAQALAAQIGDLRTALGAHEVELGEFVVWTGERRRRDAPAPFGPGGPQARAPRRRSRLYVIA